VIVAPPQLVDASAIDAEPLSYLCCTDEIVDIDLATHRDTVPMGYDSQRLTTFVVSPILTTNVISR
jgi:hypothetical protein